MVLSIQMSGAPITSWQSLEERASNLTPPTDVAVQLTMQGHGLMPSAINEHAAVRTMITEAQRGATTYVAWWPAA